MATECPRGEETKPEPKVDISSLTSMLNARWKGEAASGPSEPEAAVAGQVRSFRIVKLDPYGKKIELKLA
jgi:small subunit ribosomal protein S1